MPENPDVVDQVMGELGLPGPVERARLGQSNDVWFGTDWVLRMARRGSQGSV